MRGTSTCVCRSSRSLPAACSIPHTRSSAVLPVRAGAVAVEAVLLGRELRRERALLGLAALPRLVLLELRAERCEVLLQCRELRVLRCELGAPLHALGGRRAAVALGGGQLRLHARAVLGGGRQLLLCRRAALLHVADKALHGGDARLDAVQAVPRDVAVTRSARQSVMCVGGWVGAWVGAAHFSWSICAGYTRSSCVSSATL